MFGLEFATFEFCPEERGNIFLPDPSNVLLNYMTSRCRIRYLETSNLIYVRGSMPLFLLQKTVCTYHVRTVCFFARG